VQAIVNLFRLCQRLVRIAVFNPARLSHVFGNALHSAAEVVDKDTDLMRFPVVQVEDLLPESGREIRATLALFPKVNASISLLEAVALVLLLKKAKAKTLFEFGTYKGLCITQLALNVPEDARIHTLDLPEEDPKAALGITDPEDIEIAIEKGKGQLVPADLRQRIVFLKQDSATFDEKPFAGRMDFVFVDGAHNEPYVRNDSEKGWRMLRSGGIIAWHDCRVEDPAVVRYLLKSSYAPTRIWGTTVAFAVKP
jgi:predicted O-methyltransferase YrrM